ncbi:MAG: hypothetical protein MK179_22560, partial [Pirellulaceae bacterium]|nr:hypothetical protein [Pirellulaceae bacterium]
MRRRKNRKHNNANVRKIRNGKYTNARRRLANFESLEQRYLLAYDAVDFPRAAIGSISLNQPSLGDLTGIMQQTIRPETSSGKSLAGTSTPVIAFSSSDMHLKSQSMAIGHPDQFLVTGNTARTSIVSGSVEWFHDVLAGPLALPSDSALNKVVTTKEITSDDNDPSADATLAIAHPSTSLAYFQPERTKSDGPKLDAAVKTLLFVDSAVDD